MGCQVSSNNICSADCLSLTEERYHFISNCASTVVSDKNQLE